jgi:hypothetical protein
VTVTFSAVREGRLLVSSADAQNGVNDHRKAKNLSIGWRNSHDKNMCWRSRIRVIDYDFSGDYTPGTV